MSTFAGGAPPPLERRRAPLRITVRAVLWRTRFLVAALFVGVAASVAADAARPAPPPTVPVAVAAHVLAAGSVLRADDVAVVRMPVALVPDGAPTSPAAVVGGSIAVPVAAGMPLAAGVLVPDDLAGPDGTVVAAVRLADPAVASLLGTGMRVDVLAATAEGGRGKVVAERALVLPAPAAPGSAAGSTSGGGGLAGVTGATADDDQPLLLAVRPDEVADLAAASAGALLSAVVVP